MADGEFHVVFHGELTGELPRDAVKKNLAGLFRLSAERTEALFSGKPVIIKRGVDEATARKFEAAFCKAGAVCELRPSDERAGAEGPAPAAAPREGTPDTGAPAEGRGRATSSIASAGDPHGTMLDIAVPADLGALALDDSDAPLAPPTRAAPPQIDTSGLELATDDRPLSEKPRAEPPEIDTSGLSLEPTAR